MNPIKFLMSPLLPLSAKLRLGAEPWIPSPEPFPEDESVATFGRRRIGDEAFRLLIDPMQSGIYSGDPERMSVRSCFPRVVDVEKEYGSLIRGMVKLKKKRRMEGITATPGAGPSGHLNSMQEGIGELVNALAARLGHRVKTDAEAVRLRHDTDGGYVVQTNAHSYRADVVVLACPAHAAAPLLHPLSSEIGGLAGEIEYSPMAVLTLGYRRQDVGHPLDGFGFLAPRGEGLRLLGSLFTSSIFSQRAPDGHVLVRVMLGGARDPEVLALSDDELVALSQRELGPVLTLKGSPAMARIFRHNQAIPQYNVGHCRRVSRLEGELARHLPGLVLAGNAYYGIGINDCIKNAGPLAATIFAFLNN